MKKCAFNIITLICVLFLFLMLSGSASAQENPLPEISGTSYYLSGEEAAVAYRTHVQNEGWEQDWAIQGETAGTEGKSYRLEGIEIKWADNLPEGVNLEYRTHVENIGWEPNWSANGETAGTVGLGLRLESIQIRLTGANAENYSVVYRTHIENIGWETEWAADGQSSGSEGQGLRLEGIQIKIARAKTDLSAYQEVLAAAIESDFTAESWSAYLAVLEKNQVSENNHQTEVNAAVAVIKSAQEDLVFKPVIETITAIGQNKVMATGKNLDVLEISQISIPGYAVSDISSSADKKTAVLTLAADLLPETDINVEALIDGQVQKFTVNISLPGRTIAIREATYDDDWSNQKLNLVVDGIEVTAAYLTRCGYSVTFNVWDRIGVNANAVLFGVEKNSDGILKPTTALPLGAYTAEVVIDKGNDLILSDRAEIKVENLDNKQAEISSYAIIAKNLAGQSFILNSATLILGESATVAQVNLETGATAQKLEAGKGYKVESANSQIIAVSDSAPWTMKAVGTGTVNITITVGAITKTVPISVSETDRIGTKVTPERPTMDYVIGSTIQNKMTVTITDQYGDACVGKTNTSVSLPESVEGLVCDLINPVEIKQRNGQITLILTGALKGGQTGNVEFKNADNVTIGSFTMNTTENNKMSIKKVEIDPGSESQDNTMNFDIENKNSLTYKVGLYNSEGVYLADLDSLKGYRILFNGKVISVAGHVNGEITLDALKTIKVLPVAVGETTMEVFDSQGSLVDTRIISVTDTVPAITGIVFKEPVLIDYATTINYKNVLNLTESIADDIVNDISLSQSTTGSVRISEMAGINAGALYLDQDNNGRYEQNADTLLGTLTARISTDATGNWMPGGVIGSVITGQPVTANDRGRLTFLVTDTRSEPDIIVGTAGVLVKIEN